MCAKHVHETPQWFRSRDYTYTSGLTKEGWFIAFLDRLAFDAIPESPEFFVSDDADPWHAHRNRYGSNKELFRAYLARTQGPPGDFETTTSFPAIREISNLDDAKAVLEGRSVALIAVELDASEGTAIDQFTKWLAHRKRDPACTPSFPRRGVPDPTARVLTQVVLDSWAEQRILPLWDLLFWRKLFHQRVSNNTLGCWLFQTPTINADPTDKYNYSRRKLQEAVKLFFALRFELGSLGNK